MEPRYTMHDRMPFAEEAARRSTAFLLSQDPASRVENVEDDPHYQSLDVDLLWHRPGGVVGVECKGDAQAHRTGNYVLETLSNRDAGTAGCFLKSRADVWHYHLLGSRELHVWDLEPVRAWFLAHQDRFPRRETKSGGAAGGWTTVFRLVPIRAVLEEVGGHVGVYRL